MLRPSMHVVTLAAMLIVSLQAASAEDRPSASGKASLLVYPTVEVKWSDTGQVTQDTFLNIVNDYPEELYVQVFFVNGDGPLDAVFEDGEKVEPAHPGWNTVRAPLLLTPEEPTYFSALTGLPALPRAFSELDPLGRPDPEGPPGSRVLRGYALAWAINKDGDEVYWNHLAGDGVVVNYETGSAWQYQAESFRALSGSRGLPTDGNPGQLLLNGVEYDACYDTLFLNFFSAGAQDPSRLAIDAMMDTDLSLALPGVDLRAVNFGPITTDLTLDIWNQNEVRFAAPSRLITCWDQKLLGSYVEPNYFSRVHLQTDAGLARVNGEANLDCETFAIPAPLLGVSNKKLSLLDQNCLAESGMNLAGEGCEEASVIYDPRPVETLNSHSGDCDLNEVIDLRDLVKFTGCVSGPLGGLLHPHCQCADFDGDMDVDEVDYSVFLNVFGTAPAAAGN